MPNKVVYLSNWKENSGYSQAQRDYILSLDSVGLEVVPRNIPMVRNSADVPERLKELEKGDLNNVSTVIQHNLPNTWSYKGGVQNIGMFAYETDSVLYTGWQHYISMMDKVIVFCYDNKEAVLPINKNVFVLQHALDVDKFKQKYPKLTFDQPENCVKFYTVCEFNKRKNVEALLVAYFSEFSAEDNVALVIKTSGNMRSIADFINAIRQRTNRFAIPELYPRVVLITEHMSEFDLNSLHYNCDCFITTSRGESWCLPAMDAAGFGNTIIAPNNGAFKDYTLYGVKALLINGVMTPCFDSGHSYLYTCRENWFSCNINHIRELMSTVYKNKLYNHEKDANQADLVQNRLKYDVVGQKFKEIIEG